MIRMKFRNGTQLIPISSNVSDVLKLPKIVKDALGVIVDLINWKKV